MCWTKLTLVTVQTEGHCSHNDTTVTVTDLSESTTNEFKTQVLTAEQEETLLKAPFHGLAKPLLEMIDSGGRTLKQYKGSSVLQQLQWMRKKSTFKYYHQETGEPELLPTVFVQVLQISLLIGFISVNNSPWTDYSAYSFFQIVTMCDLVMILFFYIMHIFRVYRKLTCVSWPLAEFLHYLIGTILLLIGSIVAAAKSYNITGLVAGATFGFLATILCVISMWSSYKVSCITQSTTCQPRKAQISVITSSTGGSLNDSSVWQGIRHLSAVPLPAKMLADLKQEQDTKQPFKRNKLQKPKPKSSSPALLTVTRSAACSVM
ncbi:hypothetical protein IHE44_0000413 [Lamprotornis superbus]|uniref:MARVEL domain-containing protein n=1 Tax=Lamprotornis superbus TaxID=245042 RepID=A0A835NTN5_9PASS|nr:hypothetical protein IHE44_0000413 [Lamprotornis superbus]